MNRTEKRTALNKYFSLIQSRELKRPILQAEQNEKDFILSQSIHYMRLYDDIATAHLSISLKMSYRENERLKRAAAIVLGLFTIILTLAVCMLIPQILMVFSFFSGLLLFYLVHYFNKAVERHKRIQSSLKRAFDELEKLQKRFENLNDRYIYETFPSGDFYEQFKNKILN